MKIIGILLLFIAIMEVMFGSSSYSLPLSVAEAAVGLAFILKSKTNK